MGTNHYFIREQAPGEHERLHIGKSSAGWCYSLHVLPEEGLNSLSDWEQLFDSGAGRIEDEYGTPLEPDEMMEIITRRWWRNKEDWETRWWDYSFLGRPSPYSSEADFHEKNGSLRGPNGLLRHRIGRYCVGHGGGTWDLIPGDFS